MRASSFVYGAALTVVLFGLLALFVAFPVVAAVVATFAAAVLVYGIIVVNIEDMRRDR